LFTPVFGAASSYCQPEQSIRGLSCLLPLPTKLVKKPLSRGQSAGNPLLMFFLLGATKPQACLSQSWLPSTKNMKHEEEKQLHASFPLTCRKDQRSCHYFAKATFAKATFQKKNKEWMWGSSETGRRNLSSTSVSCSPKYNVSIHRPKPRLPQNSSDFGYFLAGLIDSDGHFNKIPQLVICFHKNDIKLAYYLKKFLGFGTVNKIKQKAAYRYVLSHRLGLKKVALFLFQKLRHPEKIQQYNERLIESGVLDLDSENSLQNPINRFTQADYPQSALNPYWLAGFVAGDGSFQIKIVNSLSRQSEEIRLVIQIDQKQFSVLKYIAHNLGGSIGYRKKQDTYYYSSVSFSNAAKWIQILDQTHLIGSKMTQYVLWRRAFLLIQEGSGRNPHIRFRRAEGRLKKAIDRLKH
jgi:LAGLIDADG endonuclease/LAGLIDADG-like domain